MDNQNQNINNIGNAEGNMGGGMPSMDENKPRGSVGPIIGLIVILVIILVGGIYYFQEIRSNMSYDEGSEGGQNTNYPQSGDLSAVISTQGTSSEPQSIENDLNNFGPDKIDSIE